MLTRRDPVSRISWGAFPDRGYGKEPGAPAMSSRKAKPVRRRVSFTVPEEEREEIVEAVGVHAPLNVIAVEEIDADGAKVGEGSDGSSDGSDSDSGSDSGGDDVEAASSSGEEAADSGDSSGSDSDSESDSPASGDKSADGGEQMDVASDDDDDGEKSGVPAAPAACNTFAEMDLDKRVSWAVAKLGWRRPTPVQAAAVPAALAGRDVLVAAPTGSGKTAAYAVPLAHTLCRARAARGHAPSDGTSALVLVPTRELASQVAAQLRKLLKFVQGAAVANLASSAGKAAAAAAAGGKKRRVGAEGAPAAAGKVNEFVRTADVLVGTPASVVALRNDHGAAVLEKVSFVVVDEADLVLSFGHGADARTALAAVPSTAQAMLVSATLESEGLDELRKVVLRHPMTVKVTAVPGKDPSAPGADCAGPGAAHYFARLSSPLDRYLVTYAMLRLNVISGKVLIFTNGISSAFRLKLFLDQFKVKAAVLNSELPANSRLHCVEQFNSGIFDILIATDEVQRDDAAQRKRVHKRPRRDADDEEGSGSSDVGSDAEGFTGSAKDDKARSKEGAAKKDSEFSVSRGVDFRGVAAVVNFDIPLSHVAYTHRAGRTARAGASGTVLSLVVNDSEQANVTSMGTQSGMHVGPLAFRMDQIEAFRYRVEDSLRAVTNAAVREARLAEVRREMLNSDRLKDYFEDNPIDLDALKHDMSLAKHVPEHLSRVPGYLLPPALRDSVSAAPITRSRRGQRRNTGRATRGSKNEDPLKTFSSAKRTGGNSRQRYKSRHGVTKPSGKGNRHRIQSKKVGRKHA